MKRILVIMAVFWILLVSGCVEISEKEQACTNSGGTVTERLCCESAGDFPNLCLIGACGCSPDNSHEVKTCDCGDGKCFDGNSCISQVNNFDECVEAGYPVMESYPRQCRIPGGRTFTEEVEQCVTSGGEIMSLSEAKQIAIESECGDGLKDTAFCNENTGTWWIDLDMEQEGCSPACVVNVVTKEAVINWRCTGLIVSS
jgi:hypothetical protein